MRKTRALSLAAFLAGAVLAVCGCGGTPDADVAGNWDLYTTEDGVPGELGPEPGFIVQSGSSITVSDDIGSTVYTGTVSGNNVTFTFSDAVGTVTFTGTVSGTHMEGTYEAISFGSPFSGNGRDLRKLRTDRAIDGSGRGGITHAQRVCGSFLVSASDIAGLRAADGGTA